ncbi:HipA domain-containing protein [Actinobacillus arthritidis]|uniref:HipA domain-containing protein n=1 Tax=Actinobacillus arthritidis TaxID=157339 RepID=UPI002441FE10|nr:HipA domain-containing protein [Actinobacillus arthritidis]WGE90178.1 HipA domain-containing protein [Actinobacillus arthritidis]
MVKRLCVLMNGELVGFFERTMSGSHLFRYAEEWFLSSNVRPISLSMPLRREVYQGKEVINFFDNLLPDHPQVRARIATRFQAETQQPFELLAKIGRDATGAITLLEENTEIPNHKVIHATELSKNELHSLLLGYRQNAPLGMLDEAQDFRISIAGAQEKTALLWHNKCWQLPHGLTPTTHIIKLPIGKIQTPKYQLDLSQSVDNELICLRLCVAFGLPSASVNLLEVGDVRALAVERFDRKLHSSNQYFLRLPYEDFCQVFGLAPTQKYESDGGIGIRHIMDKLLYSSHTSDRAQFMKTQFLFWVLGAIDGHAKNFSIALKSQSRYHLSPIYDVISAYPMLGGKGWHQSDLQLAMSLCSTQKGKKWNWQKIRHVHYLSTAKSVGFNQLEMKHIIEEISDTALRTLDFVADRLPININEQVRDQIFNGVKKQIDKIKLDRI